MQTRIGKTLFSASDLVGFLECEHLTTLALLDLVTPLPRAEDDETAVLVQQKGFAHEADFLAALKAQGLRVAEIQAEGAPGDLARETEKAMREGYDVIFQATFLSGPLYGRADFLRRVERPSKLGAHSYEVLDTKLARSAKAKFVVQLCFYSDLLAEAQGVEPKMMHLALGDGSERNFRFANYSRYFHQVRGRFLAFVTGNPNETYPERCEHCPICAWRDLCIERWSKDDHLNQVAGITRNQSDRLQAAGTRTLAALAGLDGAARVARLPPETVNKLRSQASLQLLSAKPESEGHEVLELDPDGRRGFYRLPMPDDGDMYFDMEGDPLEDRRARIPVRSALSRRRELDVPAASGRTTGRRRDGRSSSSWTSSPSACGASRALHIYHYASYEPTALKRLQPARHAGGRRWTTSCAPASWWTCTRWCAKASASPSRATRSRTSRFLHCPARRARSRRPARASCTTSAGARPGDPRELEEIEDYNGTTCRSTQLLHEWLLGPCARPGCRGKPAGATGSRRGRPKCCVDENPEVEAAPRALSRTPARRPAEGRGYLDRRRACRASSTYQLLDFHRRAGKPAWWAMFARHGHDRRGAARGDPECLAGLELDAGRAAGGGEEVHPPHVPRARSRKPSLPCGTRSLAPTPPKRLGDIGVRRGESPPAASRSRRRRTLPRGALNSVRTGPINARSLPTRCAGSPKPVARRRPRFARS